MADDPYTRQNRPAAIGLVAGILAAFALVVVVLPWYEGQQPVTEEEQVEIDEQLEINQLEMQSLIERQLSMSQMAIERDRKNDINGQALSIRCIQWTDLHETRPTENTLKQQEYACQRFNHYVTTGEILPEPDFE